MSRRSSSAAFANYKAWLDARSFAVIRNGHFTLTIMNTNKKSASDDSRMSDHERRIDAALVATFLTTPLLGAPLMIALSAQAMLRMRSRARNKFDDGLALAGHFLSHFLALACLLAIPSVASLLTSVALMWPINYRFCSLFLARSEPEAGSV